jgi:hypothetical protein
VVESDWIEPGTLVACVKAHELGHEILTGADRIILHARDLNPINYVTGYGPEPFRDTDFVDMLFNEKRGGGDVRDLLKTLATSAPDLADVLCGRIVEESYNPVGTGLQFAAVATTTDSRSTPKIAARRCATAVVLICGAANPAGARG